MRSTLLVVCCALLAMGMIVPAAVAGDAVTAPDDLTCEYPLELEDATGETVLIDDRPESVVALGPSDAQIMFEIGAEDRLVGMPVGPGTDYLDPDEDLDITEADGFTVVDETIVDRDPDVVLAANVYETDPVVDQLRDAGLTVYVFPTEDSLEGVKENVALTGEIVGECDGAAETLDWMDDRLDVVDEVVAGEDHPLGYFAMGDGFTFGAETFQHEIMTTAGLENLGALELSDGEWAPISEEVVVAEDPEWIVYGDGHDEPPITEAEMATTAAESDQFVQVNSNYMNQPGPLVVHAIEEIAATVHPDAYAEADAADGADDGADDADEGDDATIADTTEDDSIGGFGVPVAVAALLIAYGTHRYRD